MAAVNTRDVTRVRASCSVHQERTRRASVTHAYPAGSVARRALALPRFAAATVQHLLRAIV
jgi:hypothetical protein